MKKPLILLLCLAPLWVSGQTLIDTIEKQGPKLWRACTEKATIPWGNADGFLEKNYAKKHQGILFFHYSAPANDQPRVQEIEALIGFKRLSVAIISFSFLENDQRVNLVFCPSVSSQILEDNPQGYFQVPGYGDWQKFAETSNSRMNMFWINSKLLIKSLLE